MRLSPPSVVGREDLPGFSQFGSRMQQTSPTRSTTGLWGGPVPDPQPQPEVRPQEPAPADVRGQGNFSFPQPS